MAQRNQPNTAEKNPVDAVAPENEDALKPPGDSGAMSSTEAEKQAANTAAEVPVRVVTPRSDFVDPTRDSTGKIIQSDPRDLPEPMVHGGTPVLAGPSGDAITGSLRREDPDAESDAQTRIKAALKDAGMDQPISAPALDATAYKHQEAARVWLAAEAAKLDLTVPGGRYLVNGVAVDCNGRRIEE